MSRPCSARRETDAHSGADRRREEGRPPFPRLRLEPPGDPLRLTQWHVLRRRHRHRPEAAGQQRRVREDRCPERSGAAGGCRSARTTSRAADAASRFAARCRDPSATERRGAISPAAGHLRRGPRRRARDRRVCTRCARSPDDLAPAGFATRRSRCDGRWRVSGLSKSAAATANESPGRSIGRSPRNSSSET